MQLDRTESELRLSQEQNTLLTGKLHKAEREINSLNSQVRENSLSDKSDLSTCVISVVIYPVDCVCLLARLKR